MFTVMRIILQGNPSGMDKMINCILYKKEL